jgi:hypothetical protein
MNKPKPPIYLERAKELLAYRDSCSNPPSVAAIPYLSSPNAEWDVAWYSWEEVQARVDQAK